MGRPEEYWYLWMDVCKADIIEYAHGYESICHSNS